MNHGILVTEQDEVTQSQQNTTSGIPVVFGTAPIHMVENPEEVSNKPVIVHNMKDAKEKLGYNEDFEKYTLCQSMKMSLDVFKVAPVIFVNVLDVKKHSAEFSNVNVSVSNKRGCISVEGCLINSLKVSLPDGQELEKDVDYITMRDGESVYITLLREDAESIQELNVSGKKVDADLVVPLDVIGGYNADTGEETGLELVRMVYPMLGIVPSLLLAPGFSHIPEVAAVLEAKCEAINGCFTAECILDLDTEKYKKYSDVGKAKEELGCLSRHAYGVWPMAKKDNLLIYGSAVVAALTQYTDAQNENMANLSPSNKDAKIDAAVRKDGTEVLLDFVQADSINDIGIGTFLNMNGWKLWGNATMEFPADKKQKAKFWCIRRFFSWRANYFITNHLAKIDLTGNTKLLESICDEENIQCNALVAKGVCAKAAIEFLAEDNTVETLTNGEFMFSQIYAPFNPAQIIKNTMSIDIESVRATLTLGGNEG